MSFKKIDCNLTQKFSEYPDFDPGPTGRGQLGICESECGPEPPGHKRDAGVSGR